MSDTCDRIAAISIMVGNRTIADRVNEVLSRHGDGIRGRLGIPFHERGLSVITVVIEASPDRIGAINGALGNIPGVKVRSAMLT